MRELSYTLRYNFVTVTLAPDHMQMYATQLYKRLGFLGHNTRYYCYNFTLCPVDIYTYIFFAAFDTTRRGNSILNFLSLCIISTSFQCAVFYLCWSARAIRTSSLKIYAHAQAKEKTVFSALVEKKSWTISHSKLALYTSHIYSSTHQPGFCCISEVYTYI